MFLENTVQSFLDDLASDNPTPGGGSAAAAAGAMGAALVSMVCNLTIGKKKFAGVEAQMQDILEKSEALRAELGQLITDDAEAFETVMAAFRMPRSTDKERSARSAEIQAATKRATLTPLATARACAEVIGLSRSVAETGNPNAVSDAGAGAACAQAGLKAASLNVLINLPSIKDAAFVAAHRAELEQILAKSALADEVHTLVKSKL